MNLTEKFLPPDDMPDLHRPFWEGLKARELRIQKCGCGHLRFIPTEICPACGSTDWTWKKASGNGEVYTYTVVHRGPTPAYQAEAPYTIVHVTLEEGVRVIGPLVGCDPAAVRIGMSVRTVYEEVSGGWTLYRFAPAHPEGEEPQ